MNQYFTRRCIFYTFVGYCLFTAIVMLPMFAGFFDFFKYDGITRFHVSVIDDNSIAPVLIGFFILNVGYVLKLPIISCLLSSQLASKFSSFYK